MQSIYVKNEHKFPTNALAIKFNKHNETYDRRQKENKTKENKNYFVFFLLFINSSLYEK